jgi:alanine racemase
MQHLSYRISEIATIIKGTAVSGQLNDQLIEDILIDSRKLITPDNCLFFALRSKRNDGHKYIPELYERGIRNFVVSSDIEVSNFRDANFIRVGSALTALQMLAKAHREKFEIPVVGITGSNGKTIVKEWLFQVLSKQKKVVRSPKSYNSQIGVPLSVWQLDVHHEVAIFEAGISEPDEMEKLQQVIKPTIGLFTNIGEAHNENFISMPQKIGEKLKLFTKVKKLVYCVDHAEIQEIIIRSEILETVRAFTWSRKQDADLRITEITPVDKGGTKIDGLFKEKGLSITIPFGDRASIENAIHVWAAMLCMGYDHDSFAWRFEKLTPIAMRLELKAGINHCTIINDSYNSDINSLAIAIDFLNQQANTKKRTLILSDILQSGKSEEELYESIAQIVENKNIDRIIGIGPSISRQKDKFRIEKHFYLSTDDFLSNYTLTWFNNEMILLKGARIFEFEQISRALQQKSHQTVLEINLNALIQNFNYFKSKLEEGTKIMAMVKAFSYGSGTFEIANSLQFHRADYLAVAYGDEGVELRKAGIKMPIMVMNPDEQSFDAIIKHNLEPEIFNFRSLGLLEKAIRKNILPRNKPVKIHIKLDTGMHRLGFMKDEMDELLQRITENKMVFTQSVFSHLAASDDPQQDDFTRSQIGLFEEMSSRLINGLNHPAFRHILNSAGISRFPEARFDMVRLGISLYGVPTISDDAPHLVPVSTLKSIISQIKKIGPGESVSYQRSHIADRDMTIGIVPVGYADGLRRSLGNGNGSIFVKGKKAPIIGNVCMDMCMVDITDMKVKEGDEVIVFGPENRVEELARMMDTIPYELLAGIPPRVKRVYFQE